MHFCTAMIAATEVAFFSLSQKDLNDLAQKNPSKENIECLKRTVDLTLLDECLLVWPIKYNLNALFLEHNKQIQT